MKQIKYYCEICKEEKKPNELMCIYYKPVSRVDEQGNKTFKNEYTLQDNLDGSDKHVCLLCLQMINESFEEAKKKLNPSKF